jgi:hypothetical protein
MTALRQWGKWRTACDMAAGLITLAQTRDAGRLTG